MNRLNNNTIRYFDMFAGIGGFRAGLERAGGYECIGHCEIDKHAAAAYMRLHNIKESEVYYEDAKTINTSTLPEFDLLCAGFPCQAFSVAGKRKGFLDPRGTLFFEIARVVEARKPAYLLLENVPGLLSHDGGQTFAAILHVLCRLGYSCEWQVLNSKDFGVPQSRRRVYIVGYLNPQCAGQILPIRSANPKTPIQLRGGAQGVRVYDPSGLAITQLAKSGGLGGKTGLYAVGYDRRAGFTGKIDTAYTLRAANQQIVGGIYTANVVVDESAAKSIDSDGGNTGLYFIDLNPGSQITTEARCLKARYNSGVTNRKAENSGVLHIKEATKRGYKEAATGDSVDLAYAGSGTRRGRVGHGVAQTLDCGSTQGVVTGCGRIRRLMPRECFRLQGFTDEQIDKLLDSNSDNQAYKQAGNAATVNVVHALALRLKTAHTGVVAATRTARAVSQVGLEAA